jgi:hypothetical protein
VLRPLPNAVGFASPTFKVSRGPLGEMRSFGGREGDDGTLPAGRYRMYLLASEPGQVRLEFTGLPGGELELAPAVQTPQRAGPMATQVSERVVTFGEDVQIWGGGAVLLTATPTAEPGTEVELCRYDSQQRERAGEQAYGPGCPGGESVYKTVITSDGEYAFRFVDVAGDWRQSVGGNVTTLSGPPGPVDAYLFTAGFEGGPPPGWSPSPEQPPEQPPPAPSPSRPESAAAPAPSEREASPPAGTTAPTGGRECGEACEESSTQYRLDGSSWRRPASGVARLASRRLQSQGRRARVVLRCPKYAACRGRLGFRSLPSARYTLAAGETRKVSVLLPRALVRRLRQRKRASSHLLVTSDMGSEKRQVRVRVKVRAPRSTRTK